MAERSIWNIPELWPGSTIYILGGGPGLQPNDLPKLKGKRVIAVNQAFREYPQADLLYFGDGQFYRDNYKAIRGFGGIIVTSYTTAPPDGKGWPNVRRVGRSKRMGIELTKKGFISWNNNSGASAINLAYWLGAKRVVLLGFDMKAVAGKHNWHSHYRKRPTNWNPYPKHLECWSSIMADANRLGIEIVNATPMSAIKEIPIVGFEEVLKNDS